MSILHGTKQVPDKTKRTHMVRFVLVLTLQNEANQCTKIRHEICFIQWIEFLGD